ncbi:MAG: iron ABC transporter permease [Armatimonadota bacterium]|nr:iron ABC transporter permease [Armatimonadota bacterium]MDR7444758.1 iron ABC transporter permease [Armatimonadota bacterium]MDR7569240.1 iron ABC transporter permease [Armatimonadota bacterium]MDR7613358.1 iron ABC transporter permease [Armatimonadota bacterium]
MEGTPLEVKSSPLQPAGAALRKHARGWSGRGVFPILLGSTVLLLVLSPVGMLLYGSLSTSPPGDVGALSGAGFAALGDPEVRSVFLETLAVASGATALSLLIAAPLSWLIARTDVPLAGLWESLLTLPLFIPPILLAVAWSIAASPRAGLVNRLLQVLGLPGPLVNIYTREGLIWFLAQYGVAFQVSVLTGPLRALDASLEEAGRVSGAGQGVVLRRILLPLMFPVISNSALYAFARGVETFEGPLLIGLPGGIKTFAVYVYERIHHRARPEYQVTSALGIAALLFLLPLMALQWRVVQGQTFHAIGGRGYRVARLSLGPWRWAAAGLCGLYSAVSILFPALVLLLGSFSRLLGVFGENWFTWEHYRNLLRDRYLVQAVQNTLVVGLAGASAVVGLGMGVAYLLVRGRRWARLRTAVNLATWVPVGIPGVLLGLGFLWTFAFLPGPFQLYGTIWALVIADITLCLPVAVRILQGALAQLNPDLEESARVCGVGSARAVWEVVFPLLWPSVVAAWLLSFLIILREVSASIMLAAPGNQVLAVALVVLVNQGRIEEVCAAAVLTLVGVVGLRGVLTRIGTRRAHTGSGLPESP